MGRAFAVVVIVIALVSVFFFAAHSWMPPAASEHAPALDRHLKTTLIQSGFIFLLSQFLLAAFVWRYRDRSGAASVKIFPGGARGPIVAGVLLVGIELVTLQALGAPIWAKMYYERAPADSIRVYVQAEQFAYSFRYPGADRTFGPIHPEKSDPSNGNPFGLDRQNDEASRDDIVTSMLVIPVDRTILLGLHAKDVNHSLYIPEMRVQQDFVPGIDIFIHFTATKTGDYQIVCTQLCGMGHQRMKAAVRVVSQADYENWLAQQAGKQ